MKTTEIFFTPAVLQFFFTDSHGKAIRIPFPVSDYLFAVVKEHAVYERQKKVLQVAKAGGRTWTRTTDLILIRDAL